MPLLRSSLLVVFHRYEHVLQAYLQTREAFMLDSLYARFDDFDKFMTKNLAHFGNGAGNFR